MASGAAVTEINHKARAHARLGASTADRWINCPGSVRMSEGIPNVETEYSREGTGAHELIERCLTQNQNAADFVGLRMPNGVEVTEEMAEATQVFLDYVRGLAPRPDDLIFVEQKFDLARFNPPEPMYGTADFVAYQRAAHHLHVVDYKHGVGYAVDAIGNPQLRYYALGALLAMPARTRVDEITITIVQPRAAHPDGIIRSETISYEELIGFASDLIDAAHRTQDPDAPLVPGRWCRFCPARAQCPARREQALAVAQQEFGAVNALPDPRMMPVEMVAELIQQVEASGLKDWIADLYAFVQQELEAGRPVPGFKLVPKRATRKWRDEQAAAAYLAGLGYSTEEMYKLELKSPAQIEVLLNGGKKTRAKNRETLPESLVVKESSGYTLAPEHDPRPAVNPADEFPALPPATD